MTPIKASLRVAHTSTCANKNATKLDSLKGCTCKPSYYVRSSDRTGRTIKSPRVKSRKAAERQLTATQYELDQ